jgi:hypothetical protein
MKTENRPYELIPPALLAEVEAMAAAEHRPAHEMVREAVERYIRDRQISATPLAEPVARPKRTPQEAAARLLELRKGNFLPEGMTIRDMQTYGRA